MSMLMAKMMIALNCWSEVKNYFGQSRRSKLIILKTQNCLSGLHVHSLLLFVCGHDWHGIINILRYEQVSTAGCWIYSHFDLPQNAFGRSPCVVTDDREVYGHVARSEIFSSKSYTLNICVLFVVQYKSMHCYGIDNNIAS